MLHVLLQNGVHRKCFRIVENMYSTAAVSVEHGMTITDYFLTTWCMKHR